jgi:hypothetical protein
VALPTSYTEATLKAYLHAEIYDVAGALGWSVSGGSYDEAVNDALYLAGLSSIESATSAVAVYQLRKLGLLAVWRRVVAAVAADYNFSADGSSFSRSQVFDQAKQCVRTLEHETASYRADNVVNVRPIDYVHNPYQERTIEDRAL